MLKEETVYDAVEEAKRRQQEQIDEASRQMAERERQTGLPGASLPEKKLGGVGKRRPVSTTHTRQVRRERQEKEGPYWNR